MSVGIKVEVDVLVRLGVILAVADGRNVQVGRGVNVIVLEAVGEGLAMTVNVDTWVIPVLVGMADWLKKKLTTTPRNNNAPMMNSTITGIRRGEREGGFVAIGWLIPGQPGTQIA